MFNGAKGMVVTGGTFSQVGREMRRFEAPKHNKREPFMDLIPNKDHGKSFPLSEPSFV